ncbi:MAG: hypothetical protein JXR86_03410 [Spirochaetales bacterium]|nr:hypothetical protein [Spirochaetales bacterium]
MDKSQDEMISEEIGNLLRETFEKVDGFYLDKGTSLFETLDDLSSGEVSICPSGSDSSIAGHVRHISFFMRTIIGYNTGEIDEPTDWKQSWTVEKVTEGEWEELKKDLRESYELVKRNVNEMTYWKNVDDFAGILCVLAHTAFHMGAIWKMSSQIRAWK